MVYQALRSLGRGRGIFCLKRLFYDKKTIFETAGDFRVLSEIRARACRLYPFYLAFLLTVAAKMFQSKHLAVVQDFVVHILFLQDFYWISSGYQSALQFTTAHTWTLAIEVWLFLLWLAAFKLLKSTKLRYIWNYALIVCAILYRTVTTVGGADIYMISLMPIAHADAFAVGSLMALSASRKEGKNPLRRARPYIFIIGGGALIAASIAITAGLYHISWWSAYDLYKSSVGYLNNAFTCNIYLFFSILSVGLVELFGRLDCSAKPLSWLSRMGDFTYDSYLLHWYIRSLIISRISNRLLVAVIVCVASLAGAFIFEILWKRLQHYWKRSKIQNDPVI